MKRENKSPRLGSILTSSKGRVWPLNFGVQGPERVPGKQEPSGDALLPPNLCTLRTLFRVLDCALKEWVLSMKEIGKFSPGLWR